MPAKDWDSQNDCGVLIYGDHRNCNHTKRTETKPPDWYKTYPKERCKCRQCRQKEADNAR